MTDNISVYVNTERLWFGGGAEFGRCGAHFFSVRRAGNVLGGISFALGTGAEQHVGRNRPSRAAQACARRDTREAGVRNVWKNTIMTNWGN